MKKAIKLFIAGLLMAAMTMATMIAPPVMGSVNTMVAEPAQAVEIVPAAAPIVSCLTVAPGSNETELMFSWYSTTNGDRISIRKDGVDEVTSVISTDGAASAGLIGHKASITRLEENTAYLYKIVGTDGAATPEYAIKTGDPSSYSFFLVADVQIGSKGNAYITSDSLDWQNTVKESLAAFPEVSFMISAGDQVELCGNEDQYIGYLSPEELKGLPVSQTVGNHDNGNGSNYNNHFHFPNVSELGKTTTTMGDYWFTYGKTLFMNLNSNTYNAAGIAQHKQFMEEAIAANPDAAFKILTFHHSVYSEGDHSNDSDQVGPNGRRLNWTPVFDELGIDVVFSGHDHSYTRTYQMYGNEPQEDQIVNADGAVVNPTGTLYIEENSGNPLTHYNLKAVPAFFSAARHQFYVDEFSKIDMTDNSFTITTYRVDTMEVLDKYSIVKTTPEKQAELVVVSDKEVVRKNQYFNVSVALDQEVNSNAAVLTFNYDACKFQYRGFTAANGVTQLNWSNENGVVKLTVMVDDYKMLNYGFIMFSAIEDVELGDENSSIDVTVEYVLKDALGVKTMKTAFGSTSFGTLPGEDGTIPGIANPTLIDLSNAIDGFGLDKTSPNWNDYKKYDVVVNGKIDIADISTIAKLIQ